LQPRAARRPLGRRAPLTSSRALCAASSCLAPPWTLRAAHFEPRALCSLQLLGALLDAERCSLRAARPLQPQAARRPLGRCAPLTLSRALCATSSLIEHQRPLWTPTSSRAPFAASNCLASLGRRAPLTSSRAHFAVLSCSATPLDAARGSLRAALPLQPRAARRPFDAARRSL